MIENNQLNYSAGSLKILVFVWLKYTCNVVILTGPQVASEWGNIRYQQNSIYFLVMFALIVKQFQIFSWENKIKINLWKD